MDAAHSVIVEMIPQLLPALVIVYIICDAFVLPENNYFLISVFTNSEVSPLGVEGSNVRRRIDIETSLNSF